MTPNEKQFFESLRKLLKKHTAYVQAESLDSFFSIYFKEEEKTSLIESSYRVYSLEGKSFVVTEQNNHYFPVRE